MCICIISTHQQIPPLLNPTPLKPPQGKPHKRQFKVSEDLRRLKWNFLPSRSILMQRARDPVRPVTKQVCANDIPRTRVW